MTGRPARRPLAAAAGVISKPVVRRFDVQVDRCVECCNGLQGRQERQTSDATGAPEHLDGPRSHPGVAWLNNRLEVLHGKFEGSLRVERCPKTTFSDCGPGFCWYPSV